MRHFQFEIPTVLHRCTRRTEVYRPFNSMSAIRAFNVHPSLAISPSLSSTCRRAFSAARQALKTQALSTYFKVEVLTCSVVLHHDLRRAKTVHMSSTHSTLYTSTRNLEGVAQLRRLARRTCFHFSFHCSHHLTIKSPQLYSSSGFLHHNIHKRVLCGIECCNPADRALLPYQSPAPSK